MMDIASNSDALDHDEDTFDKNKNDDNSKISRHGLEQQNHKTNGNNDSDLNYDEKAKADLALSQNKSSTLANTNENKNKLSSSLLSVISDTKLISNNTITTNIC